MSTAAGAHRRTGRRALPISVKIAFALGLALLATGVISVRLVQDVVEAGQIAATLRQLETLSTQQAIRLPNALEREVEAVRTLTREYEIQQRLTEEQVNPSPMFTEDEIMRPSGVLQRRIAEFKVSYPELTAVVILDAEGHILAGAPLLPEEELPAPGGWSWFGGMARTGRESAVLLSPRDDHLTGEQGIHIVLPVYSAGGLQYVGSIYAVWDMSNFSPITPASDQQTIVLVSPDISEIGMGTHPWQNGEIESDVRPRILSSTTEGFVYDDPSGERWLFGVVRVSATDADADDLPGGEWYVVTRQPARTALAGAVPIVTRLRLAIGLSAAAGVLVAALVAIVVLRPLRRLTEAAQRIRGGELNAPIPSLPADEVGTLADVMDELVGALLARLDQLNAAVHISQEAGRSLDRVELMERVTHAVATEFECRGAAIYLLGAGEQEVQRRAAAGDPDLVAEMPMRFPLDEDTATGRAILLRTAQLGGPREMALPLATAGRMLGALVVVMREPVEREDVNVMRLVADQIGASIENARLFEESASRLDEIEALNRRLTRGAWQETLEKSRALRYTRDPEERWPAPPGRLGERGQISAETYLDADGRSVLAAPLVLRGESIGALAVTRPQGTLWTHDEHLLVEAVAARLSLIAEGIRLVEETSWRAEREQRISRVSANLFERTSSVEDVVQAALDELSGVLGSDHVSLRIGSPPSGGEGDGKETRGAPAPGAGESELSDG
jgi:GAF domain-containing protein/HAMP domain-containing protein